MFRLRCCCLGPWQGVMFWSAWLLVAMLNGCGLDHILYCSCGSQPSATPLMATTDELWPMWVTDRQAGCGFPVHGLVGMLSCAFGIMVGAGVFTVFDASINLWC